MDFFYIWLKAYNEHRKQQYHNNLWLPSNQININKQMKYV